MVNVERSIANGKVYLTATYRGTEYTISRNDWGWDVHTRRLALGRWNTGGFKRFATFGELQAKCKAFAGVDILTAM